VLLFSLSICVSLLDSFASNASIASPPLSTTTTRMRMVLLLLLPLLALFSRDTVSSIIFWFLLILFLLFYFIYFIYFLFWFWFWCWFWSTLLLNTPPYRPSPSLFLSFLFCASHYYCLLLSLSLSHLCISCPINSSPSHSLKHHGCASSISLQCTLSKLQVCIFFSISIFSSIHLLSHYYYQYSCICNLQLATAKPEKNHMTILWQGNSLIIIINLLCYSTTEVVFFLFLLFCVTWVHVVLIRLL